MRIKRKIFVKMSSHSVISTSTSSLGSSSTDPLEDIPSVPRSYCTGSNMSGSSSFFTAIECEQTDRMEIFFSVFDVELRPGNPIVWISILQPSFRFGLFQMVLMVLGFLLLLLGVFGGLYAIAQLTASEVESVVGNDFTSTMSTPVAATSVTVLTTTDSDIWNPVN